MTRRLNLDQWTTREELPAIVWTYTGVWELVPVAVNDSHDSDVYNEYAAAFFAARAYQTAEEVEQEHADELSPEEIADYYENGPKVAAYAGLPTEWYVEGAAEDGSDVIIYVDEETSYNSRREDWQTAVPYLDPEDVNDVWQIVADARRS